MIERNNPIGLLEFLRSTWFLIIFIGGLVYWAAKQDSAIAYAQKDEVRITTLENRANVLEKGIGQLETKIDGIKEDVTLIKTAVMKNR
ncbi:MAG TPA: hypothetical protein PKJ33_02790 [Alphaproteobacteria bacterium]|nr:hypothetical protein [Alphaproteobacteria bacterium]